MANKKTAPKKTATKKVTKKTVTKTTKTVKPKESFLNQEVSAKNSFLVILLAATIIIAAFVIRLY